MGLLLWVKGPDDPPYLYRVPLLRCDACGEERVASAVMIVGEIHGCPRLGAFRLTEPLRVVLVMETSSQ
jgi:hypothetical protein